MISSVFVDTVLAKLDGLLWANCTWPSKVGKLNIPFWAEALAAISLQADVLQASERGASSAGVLGENQAPNPESYVVFLFLHLVPLVRGSKAPQKPGNGV